MLLRGIPRTLVTFAMHINLQFACCLSYSYSFNVLGHAICHAIHYAKLSICSHHRSGKITASGGRAKALGCTIWSQPRSDRIRAPDGSAKQQEVQYGVYPGSTES